MAEDNQQDEESTCNDQDGDYNLRYNIQNLTEDFFLPVRGGDSGTQIEGLPLNI